MSIKLMSRVWDMRGLPLEHKMVLLRMADHANPEGRCYPSQESLALDCERSERTIRYKLADLDRLGLVEKLRRHRRGPQEYRLWIPDDPSLIDWSPWVERVTADEELHLGHGWFDQDRPPVAGQTWIDLDEEPALQDRQPTSGLPGGLDRQQDRQPVTVRPATGDSKTGNGLPVAKSKLLGNRQLTVSEPRARRSEPIQISDAEVRALAVEKARAKGARNLGALAEKIYREDHELLIAELLEEKTLQARLDAVAACPACDDRGFRWVTAAGDPAPPDDLDAETAVVCGHTLTEALA